MYEKVKVKAGMEISRNTKKHKRKLVINAIVLEK